MPFLDTEGVAGLWEQTGQAVQAAFNKTRRIDIAQVSSSVTLSDTYLGKHMYCTNTSDITITIPAGLGAGFNCTLERWGTGGVSISVNGTTINGAADALAIGEQYNSAVSIIALTDTEYSVKGGLA